MRIRSPAVATCAHKLAYGAYINAERAARHLRRKHEKFRYRVYRCSHCSLWHVGRIVLIGSENRLVDEEVE